MEYGNKKDKKLETYHIEKQNSTVCLKYHATDNSDIFGEETLYNSVKKS